MWQRRTFHECAEELEAISRDFRSAYTNSLQVNQQNRDRILQESSKRGIEVLRVLALSIRSEQDFEHLPPVSITVGALKESVNDNEISATLDGYQPPYSEKSGFEPLVFREALNKIAHANPSKSGFFANDVVHDLILSGSKGNNVWIAIVSIIDLCRTIKSLPDRNTQLQQI